MEHRFYQHEEVMSCKWFRDLYENGTLPHKSDFEKWSDDNYFGGYCVRLAYTQTYGFAMITDEVVGDLYRYLSYKSEDNTYKTLEVCCGTGYLSYRLQEAGVDMIAIDNRTWKNTREDFFQKDYTSIESIDAADAIDKYHDQIKVVIMSWPNYGDDIAYEVLKKCIKYDLVLIYIGEHEGGCTAADNFFDLLQVQDVCYDCYTLDDNYVRFPGINDQIWIINDKEE